MTEVSNEQLINVYEIESPKEAQEVYDEWAETYEADLAAMDHRVPAVAATVFARFVPLDDGSILDAGCGTGVQSEPLHLAGYGPIVGVDLSAGMLELARRKNIYAALHQAELGNELDFDDDAFANVISVGAITPGHAPPHSFDELIRVTRPGGRIIFGMRVDDAQDPEYPETVAGYAKDGRWSLEFETAEFATLPVGDPELRSRVYVYRVA